MTCVDDVIGQLFLSSHRRAYRVHRRSRLVRYTTRAVHPMRSLRRSSPIHVGTGGPELTHGFGHGEEGPARAVGLRHVANEWRRCRRRPAIPIRNEPSSTHQDDHAVNALISQCSKIDKNTLISA